MTAKPHTSFWGAYHRTMAETAIPGISLTVPAAIFFSGGVITSTGTAFHYLGSIQIEN
ncbi:MAG: hypothetical protein ACLR6J_11140 [Parabacteroides merdae]